MEAARQQERVRGRRFLALSLMIVAALFSGIVVGIMAVTHLTEQATTPLDPKTGEARPPETHTLRVLHEQLGGAEGEAAAAIKEAIRHEDQRIRVSFRTYRRRLYWGGWLLLAGLVGLVLSARWYAALDAKQPMPKPLAERPDAGAWMAARRRNLIAVSTVGGALAIALVVTGLTGGSKLPMPEEEGGSKLPMPEEKGGKPATLPVVDRAGFQDDWPRFRGPTGMGIVQAGDWPTDWDAKSGKNILWKTPLPTLKGGEDGKQVVAYGKGSPVVWGSRVFLTGGSEEKLEVFCYERRTGRLLWRTPFESPLFQRKPKPGDDEDEFKVFEDTGFAAATPATDGRRVYAVFATGDVAALDFDGKILWHKYLGQPDNMYGMASSLVVYNDLVILQHDQGGDPEDKLSALIAFDAATGRERWRTPRPVPSCWTTPVIVNTGRRTEIITSGNEWLIGYDPAMGTELWRAEGVTGDVAPSPIFAGGLILATNQYSRLVAIRAGGRGNITKTHTVWEAEEGMSDASSPVCDGRLFFQAHSGGLLTCYDVTKTKPPEEGMKWPMGHLVWEKELDAEFWASPALVGKRVYLTGKKGKTYVFPLAETFKLQATNELGEEVFASPAFGDGQIIFRTNGHLVCIARQEGQGAPAPAPEAKPKAKAEPKAEGKSDRSDESDKSDESKAKAKAAEPAPEAPKPPTPPEAKPAPPKTEAPDKP